MSDFRAKRDDNRVPVIQGLSSVDDETNISVRINPLSKGMLVDGSGYTQQVIDTPLTTKLDDSADPVIYIGKAQSGSDIDDPVWQIAKLDTSSGLSKTWAGTGFDQIWTDRTTLTY
jgi:hypothetical protein